MTKCINCEQEEAMENNIYCEKCDADNFSQYCKDVSAAYWAEEDEIKMGVHPSQIIE